MTELKSVSIRTSAGVCYFPTDSTVSVTWIVLSFRSLQWSVGHTYARRAFLRPLPHILYTDKENGQEQ